MTVILLGVTLSGVVIGKLFQAAGIHSLEIRYALTVVCSYAVFLLFVRIWLWYVAPAQAQKSASTSGGDGPSLDSIDLAGVSLPDGGGLPDSVSGAGGSFGGGGASGSFADSAESSAGSGSASGGSGSFDLSLGDADDAGALILLLLLAAAAAIFAGVWVYAIYQAPVILSEAFFQMLLASGVFRRARQMHEVGWAGSVLRATWIPFGIVLALSFGIASAVSHFCPTAETMVQAVRSCVLPAL